MIFPVASQFPLNTKSDLDLDNVHRRPWRFLEEGPRCRPSAASLRSTPEQIVLSRNGLAFYHVGSVRHSHTVQWTITTIPTYGIDRFSALEYALPRYFVRGGLTVDSHWVQNRPIRSSEARKARMCCCGGWQLRPWSWT